jgi:hypothetical protein
MSDPARGTRDPATARFPKGCLEDLTHARIPKLVVLKGATHFAQFEAGRSKLFEEVDAFLRNANRGSPAQGR